MCPGERNVPGPGIIDLSIGGWFAVGGVEGPLARAEVRTEPTITGIDTHHRDDCLPLMPRPRRITLNPRQNPESEGRIMMIHLLTCLALTAVTLSVFSWYVLTEECN
jgi:hypothetical protein